MNKLVIDTLRPLGIPVEFLDYSGNAQSYITFFFYNEFGALRADDKEIKTVYSCQVDVFTKGNNIEIVKHVRELLEGAGFIRTFATDEYERGTKLFRKILRFSYVTETKED